MKYDMDLVTFDTKAEGDYFASIVPNEAYWVGINDLSEEGKFRKYNDLRQESGSFLKWASGKPAIGNNEKDCVYVGPNSYNDHICSEYVNVACERRTPIKLAKTTQSTTVPDPGSDFRYKGSSCELILTIIFYYKQHFIISLQ
jgi:hypothetical protein